MAHLPNPRTKGDLLVTLYSTIDDLMHQAPPVPRSPRGRPAILSVAEVVTGILYAVAVAGSKTLRAAYNLLTNSHRRDFLKLPTYEGFVAQAHRVLPQLPWALRQLCQSTTTDRIRLVDATKVPVSANVRASQHRVAKGVAAWGKTSQGWFFGFKLHLGVTEMGSLRMAILTPGNVNDRRELEPLLRDFRGLAIGDAGYLVSSADHHSLWDRSVWLLTGVRKNMRKLMTGWQHDLLKVRQKVEDVIDYLKEHLGLVSSFPRSVAGYVLHYVVVLIAYQLHTGLGIF